MYTPAFTVDGTYNLGHGGSLLSLSFAPERGIFPVQCFAALLPRSAFKATMLTVSDRTTARTAVIDLARHHEANVAINGGFFDYYSFASEGLLVIDGNTVAHMRADYSGAAAIDADGRLSIVSADAAKSARFAVQGKPNLVDSGGKMGMHSENGLRGRRSFIAQSNDVVIVGVTSPVTLYHLADVFVQYPDAFGLQRIDAALNLSGDATSSFYARMSDGTEVLRGASWPNRDVIAFTARPSEDRI